MDVLLRMWEGLQHIRWKIVGKIACVFGGGM
jgi:hypothetical protein